MWVGKVHLISHCEALKTKQKTQPRGVECMLATGTEESSELPKLSFLKGNSECSCKHLSNSERARHNACFSFLFLLPVKTCHSRNLGCPEQRLCLPSSWSLLGVTTRTPQLCGTQAEGKTRPSSLLLFLASTALPCWNAGLWLLQNSQCLRAAADS